MKVCIDIQAAVAQAAGVGRYTRRLVEHLAPLAAGGGDGGLRLFYFDFLRGGVRMAAGPGTEIRPCRMLPGRMAQFAWRWTGHPDFAGLAGPADVYHFPNFTAPPLRRGRMAITIHDVSFLRYPQFAEKRNRRRLAAALPPSAARAGAVITISRFSAAEIAAALKVDPARIHVTYPGIETRFKPADEHEIVRMRAALDIDRPYLLTVGTIEPRKNHVFLAEVFERLGGEFDGLMVIAGAPGWQTGPILKRLRASPRAADIRVLAHVPEALLPALYSDAAAFLFPSYYEGFGFPPLEAMACGAPVIVSEGGALPEVMDTDAAARPGALDTEAWTQSVCAVLTEGAAARAGRRAAGRRHAARYDWAATARATWKIYQTLLNG